MTKNYKVSYTLNDRPFIRLSGKWLKDYGFNIGNSFKLVSGKNFLLLIKNAKND